MKEEEGRKGDSFLTSRTGIVVETLLYSLDATTVLKKWIEFGRPEIFRLCTPISFAEIGRSSYR